MPKLLIVHIVGFLQPILVMRVDDHLRFRAGFDTYLGLGFRLLGLGFRLLGLFRRLGLSRLLGFGLEARLPSPKLLTRPYIDCYPFRGGLFQLPR